MVDNFMDPLLRGNKNALHVKDTKCNPQRKGSQVEGVGKDLNWSEEIEQT